jgi:DNA (cytosine-5)-methyltransferase 1
MHIERQMAPGATVAQAIGDLVGAKQLRSNPNGADIDQWKIDGRRSSSCYAKALRSPDGTFTSHRITLHTPAVLARFAATAPGGYEKIGRHPRLAADGQCPTLRAGTGVEKGSFQSVRPIHPTENRVITVREAARLQGFPDNHIFHPTVWHSFRMIGNSVSPIIAKAMFLAVANALGLELRGGLQVEPKVLDLASVRTTRRRQTVRGTQHPRSRIRLAGR